MKIILSRKGFDSANGGYPSPILPDGKMVSLPIPEEKTGVTYSQLLLPNGENYGLLMHKLVSMGIKMGKERLKVEDANCHLDPDIYKDIKPRAKEWRGVFGQVNGSQTQLENQGVKEGDLFLFFGWFRKTVNSENGYCYDKTDMDGRHVLFGYLQIGEIMHPKLNGKDYTWIGNHPHLNRDNYSKSCKNTLYLAADNFSLAPKLPGYGVFKFSHNLVLSKEGETKSKWALPEFFRETYISGQEKEPWKAGYFQSVGRGQEFVLESTPKIEEWASKIITRNISC